jgi:hypothetical protein
MVKKKNCGAILRTTGTIALVKGAVAVFGNHCGWLERLAWAIASWR